MQDSNSWKEETAKEIIWEFDELLFQNDIRINNKNSSNNEFENINSCINIKDYEELKKKVMQHLENFEDYLNYYKYESAA